MTEPTIGQTFTTARSNVTGTVTEVVKNDNGSYRIKLDVNGATRWTTAKQPQWGYWQFVSSPCYTYVVKKNPQTTQLTKETNVKRKIYLRQNRYC